MFVAELEGFLSNQTHRERVVRGMKSAGSAKAFREALTQNKELRDLAIQPLATERHVWTAYIWRFLELKVFSFEGIREFYFSPGQNAAYYIKNIDEINFLMQYENEKPSGKIYNITSYTQERRVLTFSADEFARRLWKTKAIDAVFPTGDDQGGPREPGANLFPDEDHPWLASIREAKIEDLAARLLRVFGIFANIHPDGLGATRRIITHAIRLNEYMMHEAQTIYTVDLESSSESDDEFYDNLDNMRMTAVNTDSGNPVNVTTAMRGQPESDTRKRLYKICTIEPAFRSQSWSGSDTLQLQKGPVKTEAKSWVAVGWALDRNKRPQTESMFYIMAQSLGFAPPAEA